MEVSLSLQLRSSTSFLWVDRCERRKKLAAVQFTDPFRESWIVITLANVRLGFTRFAAATATTASITTTNRALHYP